MRAERSLVSTLSLLLALHLLPVSAFAQTGAGSLTGIVSDQSGAKVPGATVTAINEATHVAYTAVSNEAGNYSPRAHGVAWGGKAIWMVTCAVVRRRSGCPTAPSDATRQHRITAGSQVRR